MTLGPLFPWALWLFPFPPHSSVAAPGQSIFVSLCAGSSSACNCSFLWPQFLTFQCSNLCPLFHSPVASTMSIRAMKIHPLLAMPAQPSLQCSTEYPRAMLTVWRGPVAFSDPGPRRTTASVHPCIQISQGDQPLSRHMFLCRDTRTQIFILLCIYIYIFMNVVYTCRCV